MTTPTDPGEERLRALVARLESETQEKGGQR